MGQIGVIGHDVGQVIARNISNVRPPLMKKDAVPHTETPIRF